MNDHDPNGVSLIPGSAPSPRKGTGSGVYFAIAGAMLLIIAGLVAWKLGDQRPDPQPAPAVAPTSRPEPLLEQPPPPPPSADVPPAASSAPAAKAAGRQAPAAGNCDESCTGDAGPALRSELRSRALRARACYEKALLRNPGLQGRLEVAVRVGKNGQVCSASSTLDQIGEPTVAACVVKMFRAAAFPAPRGGCVDTKVPMNFVPKS
ncbi:MAG TPA: AgmX/PglI C-terminal domain-containing protein [Polyangiaceae bacterium]|jgi:outer membrane biosynthesis protein TonB